MSLEHPAPEPQFVVVLNDEEQYSIWPDGREIPAGWKSADCRGSKDACLAYITAVWTDMRPLSLRRQMGPARPTGA
jgi:MbtH protein